jgi:hypothetical protein
VQFHRQKPSGKGQWGRSVVAAVLLFFLLASCQTQPRLRVEPLPHYDAAFERASGWTGGDGAYSTALGADRLLWLFGDSLIGRVEDGRRLHPRLIHNSVAIQSGPAPSAGGMAFTHREKADGSPEAFFQAEQDGGWLWPYHGVRTPRGLYLFLLQIEPAEGPAAFGFRLVSTWLGRVANPDEPPERWNLLRQRVPWTSERRVLGSWVLVQGGTCYIYGTIEEAAAGAAVKHMIVARAPIDRLGDFGAWRFFSGTGWAAEAERAERVCENVAGEFSVSYHPALGRYALVYTEGGLSPDILLRFSPRPEGPWGKPLKVYRCPEAARDPRIFCYAAKGHPELAEGPKELVVTYMANATELALLESDARLYRPRFVRITFEDAPHR